MKTGLRLALALGLSAAACGGGTPGMNNGNPDAGSGSGTPDADTSTGDLAPPAAGEGFQLRSADIHLAPGEEATYCWYFTIPESKAVGVKEWKSRISPGSHHMIMFFTPNQQAADGTVVKDCGFAGTGLNAPIWTYSTQTEDQDQVMPDGVGMAVGANQHGFLQLHYINASDQPIDAHATVNGYVFADGVAYQQAQPFITYNTQINIPAGVGQQASAEGSCTVPAGSKFFTLSTHSHRRSVHTWVADGTTTILDSTDWEHPTIDLWNGPSYYQFSGKLTYHCDYVNDLNQTVTDGDSADTNEMCMAVGYYFPGTGPTYCLDSTTF